VTRDAAIRAFFAVDLDAVARRAAADLAAALREGPGGDAVRWVRPEALHVTLRFLGDIDPAEVARLARRVVEQLAPLEAFDLSLGSVQLFPSARRPRVVALQVAPPEPLERLAAAVERGVVAAGLPAEGRPFRAHLTLGRVRRGERAPATRGLAAPEGTACQVAETVLFRSDLDPAGALYTPLERLKLGGGGAPLRPPRGGIHEGS
jgi:2'-5' RNA ligase